MRRKANALNPLSPSALSTSDSDGPKSPASTGAMDDLLQKLRAAKPEARDQRDRRRRARLKDRHQVRVASGQIPELGVNMEDEQGEGAEGEGEASKGLLSPQSETAESEGSTAITSPTDNGDVADRAAALLENLGSGGGLNKDGSLSVRRRRESADSERERRRRRRQQASSRTTDDGALMSPSTIPEEGAEGDGDREGEEGKRSSVVSGDGTDSQGVSTPVTIVHPPSPEQRRAGVGTGVERELPTPPPE